MLRKQHFIHEKSQPIKINNNISTFMKATYSTNEYSLKKNFFDPTKFSPPNEFMKKLHFRIDKYHSDMDRSFEVLDNK